MEFKGANLLSHNTTLIAFTSEQVTPRGYLETRIMLEGDVRDKSILAQFLVIDHLSAYNVILQRPTLNVIRAIVFAKHLTMNFIGSNGKVVIVKGNQQVARKCYSASLSTPKESHGKCKKELIVEAHNVNLASIDPRINDSTDHTI